MARPRKTLLTDIVNLVQPHSEEGSSDSPMTLTRDAAVLIEGGTVKAAGPAESIRSREDVRGADEISLAGRSVVPGFVDSHTHLVFGAERVDEMARRCRGETYQQIAKAGGGIMSSVRAIDERSVEDLATLAVTRAATMLDRGTTTVEIKTGYGMSVTLERKMLEVIEEVASRVSQSVYKTLLAHVLPPSKRTRPDDRIDYIDGFRRELLAPLAERFDFFDCFVEDGAFSVAEARSLGQSAREYGLRLKYHVDQFGAGGGAELCAELGALSADHLEHVTDAGARCLSEAGVIATVLPGCALFLGNGDWPNARLLRESGCEVAVATDFNPGSSHISDLSLCGMMSATQSGLSLEEALWGITRGGAKALNLNDRGRLSPGERADLIVVDSPDWRALFYHTAAAPIEAVMVDGEVVRGNLRSASV